MSIIPDSVKDDVKEVIEQVAEEVLEKIVPVLNIKIPELIAEIPEVIKDENVKKCFLSFNFGELFRSLMAGLTKKKNIVSSE
jgi:2-hydroxy-3-keto-5-methylthiopentenyl-1-phosphate phosphatase